MNLTSIAKIVLVLVFVFTIQTTSYAQNFKGFIYDDVPATLNIKPSADPNEYVLTVSVIGNEANAWVFYAEFDYNYDQSRERFFGNDGGDTGLFLYDVSEDSGLKKGTILSGYTYSPEDNYEIRKMVFFLN